MIKPAYFFSFLLSINIFVWQNVLYFLNAPRIRRLMRGIEGIDVDWTERTENTGQNKVNLLW